MSAHSVDDSSRAAALSLLQASLAGRIIYNSKFFCIRTTLPGSVPKRAYYLDEFDVLRLSDLPNHIRMLRAAKGEAKGLIPVTKELFDVLVAAGISTEKVDDDSLKWAIIPGDHVRHMISMHVSTVERRKKHLAMVASHVAKHGSVSLDPNMKTIHDDEFSDGEVEAADVDLHEVVRNPAFEFIDDSIVVVGRAKRGARDDPVMIFTLAEASLKSRVHSHQMANALMRRLNAVIDTSVYAITRRGDNSIQVHPAQHIKEHGVDCIKNHPIDVKTVALIPGISKIYDPNQEPKRVLEAKKEMAKMDVERAQRIAQGLPLEDEPTPGAAQFDSRGRPIENPRAYRYATLKVIIDEEEKRRQGRMIFGEAIADGAGGIPVLSTTRALCLMSGGIDSPVAAYNMMQRGCHVDLIHFLNSTSDTAAILRKLYLITQRLSIAQGRVELMVVDIAELQQAIVGVVQRLDRTVVYKQYMLLIAAAVSGYHLLITGDSVAQVASQTANNISTLYPHCPRAIMSPLAGTNKTAIMEVSERLGLFSLSAMEGADCCQYLMCKTGANLCIGPGKMRGYLAKIRVPDIPVRTVVFQNGQEVPSASRQFTVPFDSITVNHAITIQNLAENVAPRAAVLRRRAEAEADARLQSAAATNGSMDGAKAPSVHVDPTPSSTRPSRQSYLDSAAASIIDPAVVDAMARAPVGNPNSVHTVGRVCRAAVEGVRHQLLSYLCPTSSVPFQLIFTSGGTEANNIAIQGLARALMRTASPAHASQQKTCVMYSCIAHPSIVEVAKNLAAQGVVDEAVPIPVTTDGTTDLATLTALLDSRSSFKNNADALDAGNTCRFTGLRQSGADLAAPDAPLWSNVLIAMDLVNHELGNLRDMEPITRIARSFGALLHVDACQALCKVEFDASPFDSVSVTAHKINGPIGVGALAMRSSFAKRVPAIMSGGSYDGGLRPGTLNAPGIIGFGAALSLPRDESTVNEAFDMLVQGVKSLRGVRLNGDVKKSSRRIVHVTLIGAPPDVAALSDLEIVSLFAAQFNVMLSTGAACSQSKGEAPGARANAGLYDALGLPGGVTLRVSLDHNTALRDVDAFLRGLRKVMRAPAAEGNSAAAS